MMCVLESLGRGGLSPQRYLGWDHLGMLADNPRAQLPGLGHDLPKHHAPLRSEYPLLMHCSSPNSPGAHSRSIALVGSISLKLFGD